MPRAAGPVAGLLHDAGRQRGKVQRLDPPLDGALDLVLRGEGNHGVGQAERPAEVGGDPPLGY